MINVENKLRVLPDDDVIGFGNIGGIVAGTYIHYTFSPENGYCSKDNLNYVIDKGNTGFVEPYKEGANDG